MLGNAFARLTSSPLVAIHIATLLFGLAGVLGAVLDLNAIEVTFGRTLFASAALYLVCRAVSSRSSVQRPSRSRGILLLSGALLAFHWVSFFAAIKFSTVAIGLITFATCPVFVALLEPVAYKEGWRVESFVAAGFVMLGVFIISGASSGELIYWRGILWGLASGLSFAVLQLLNRSLIQSSGALNTAMVQNCVASIILLPWVVLELSNISAHQWLLLVFLGVVCTALAHTLFINALKQVSATTASLIAAGLEPVYGASLAVLILSQIPSANMLAGGVLILITVLLVSRYTPHRNSE